MRNSKLVPIFFGLVCASIVFIGFNVYCAYRFKEAGQRSNYIHDDYDESIKSFIVPSNILKNLNGTSKYKDVFKTKTELNKERSKDGWFLEPNSKNRSLVTVKSTGEIAYDHIITLDDKRRRRVEQPHNIKNDTAVIFLGCSLTFGVGVNDFETFPSKLSRELLSANTYNLGVSGSSASQIYYHMTSGDKNFYKSISEKNIIFVYTFFDGHLFRQSCDITCYYENKWMLDNPRYQLNAVGDIEYLGTFRDYFSPNMFTDMFFLCQFLSTIILKVYVLIKREMYYFLLLY